MLARALVLDSRRTVTRILLVRGQLVTPWELRPWLELGERYEVRCLITTSNRYSAPEGLALVDVRSLRDYLPRGRIGDLAALALGDRYLSADEAFAWADIVHAEELSYWFSADAARRRATGRFKLVQTVWETLPMLAAFRNRHARGYRDSVLSATDLFLPATERAALALRLEGVPEDRMIVCPPGIDTARFARADPPAAPAEHVLISPGRLAWEKGHQDVLRAAALLHRGIVGAGSDGPLRPWVQIVGQGPEQDRLRAHADELGIGGAVTIGSVPYDEMPSRLAAASAMVLATQASASMALHPADVPRAFWEEQFGMVLAEAMAAGLDIVTTTSGAVPEVLAGTAATLVAPGDWVGLARVLAAGPLARTPGERVAYPAEIVERYSTTAAARRLAAAYASVAA
jgi:glycosyltransferase involved in cell wall biosynthesis